MSEPMTPNYKVVLDEAAPNRLEFRGANRQIIACKDKEAIVSGGAETGKTFACLTKVHLTLLKYPNAQGAMVRKTQSSIPGTCAMTFNRIIKGAGVRQVGGLYPTRYLYPNGSALWLAAWTTLTKFSPVNGDFIYVNQAEELSLNDWETLLTRCTGRGSVVKWPQLFW